MIQSAVVEDQTDTATIRIAIAEEQPLLREALARWLSREPDFEVVGEARSPTEATDLVRETEPDILLLDLEGGEKAVEAAVARLAAVRRETRILLLAVSQDVTMHVSAVRAGACGIVLKQSPPEILLKSIRKVHCGEFWIDRTTMAAVMKEFASTGGVPDHIRSPSGLSPREREIVQLVGQGLRNKQIADKLSVTEQTVKNSLHGIFRRFGLTSRSELALYAARTQVGA